MNPLLSVEDLTVERGGRVVLSELSFRLDSGEAILVSGRNGAGKSTLLRTIACLLPAQRGLVGFGRASEEVRGVETVHYLGYEDALKPSLSVGENLGFWASMLATPDSPHPEERSGVSKHRGALSPSDALAALDIARLIDLPAAYLSAGQKRRVALARLLLVPRPIWLLDEPLIALDKAAQATLTAMMTAHLASRGAILVASHQTLSLPHREIDLDSRATPDGPR